MKLPKLTDKQLNLIFSGVVAAFTIFNGLLWFNGREEIKQLKRTAQGEFILTLTRDFFLNERLYRVRKAIENGSPIFQANRGEFTEQDIDDYIGYFDLMKGLLDKKILEEDLTIENFCEFAEEAYKNKEIINHVNTLRERNPKTEYYKNFEDFAKKCQTLYNN